MKFLSAVVASSVVAVAVAFAPISQTRASSSTALPFSLKQDEDFRKVLSGAVAAVFLATNVAAFPALAMDEFVTDISFFSSSSTELVAARSGGRSGGRVSSGGNSRSYRSSAPSSSYRPSYSSSTTVIAPPTPTVIVSPGYSMGYSYNPLGGLATGYALGTLGNVGNAIQDARQESEIRQSRYELEQARMKEAELEGRLRALESQQLQPAR